MDWRAVTWDDASHGSYTAESTVVNGHDVTVCLDDEGSLYPAFYWEVRRGNDGELLNDGWESSVARARRTAVGFANSIEGDPQ